MKVILAEHYGVCFGVRDAIAEAERLAAQGPLSILGELVHNPVVRERLARQGVHEASLGQVGSAPTAQVMITAHGAADRDRDAWRRAGFGVADGTCPLVRHAHDQLRTLVEMGYTPVVIGKRGHVEVQGLIGDFPEAVVIENEEQVFELPKSGRYGVISQTTQPIERVRSVVDAIRTAHPHSEVLFRDTVCQPTKRRQEALRKLLEEVDTLVVVGGRNSNNTLQLVAAGEAAGKHVVHVQDDSELEAAAFIGSRIVGITAGTSTLRETVEGVRQRILSIAEKTVSPLAQA